MQMSTRNGIVGKILIGIFVVILIAGAGVLAFWLTHRVADNKNCTEMVTCAEAVRDAFETDEDGKVVNPEFVYNGKFDVDYVKSFVFKNSSLSASSFTWGANNTYPTEGVITVSVNTDGTLCYFAYAGFQWGYQTQIYQIDLSGNMKKVTSMDLPETAEE